MPSVPRVLLLSRDEGVCICKASHLIIPPISWSQRLWLLQRPFKKSLIQSSFVLQDSCLCRPAILKDVRMGEWVQHKAVRTEEVAEMFGTRRWAEIWS